MNEFKENDLIQDEKNKQMNYFKNENEQNQEKIKTLSENSRKILSDVNGNVYSVLIGFSEMGIPLDETVTTNGISLLSLSKKITFLLKHKKETIDNLLKDFNGSDTNSNFKIINRIKLK